MTCLIVDDDPVICDLIEHFCAKIQDITSVITTTSGFESVNLINSSNFDMVFLDFNLPDITGEDIVRLIPKTSAVVMITSNKGFASDSYNYDQIVDFLVKPIDFSRFFKAFQKAKDSKLKHKEKSNRLFIKDGNRLVKIELEQVRFFKSEANYISVTLEDKKILTLMTMKDLQHKLPDYFQRVHRSYIVNLNKVDAINNSILDMGEDQVPISQSYEKQLLEKINLLN